MEKVSQLTLHYTKKITTKIHI